MCCLAEPRAGMAQRNGLRQDVRGLVTPSGVSEPTRSVLGKFRCQNCFRSVCSVGVGSHVPRQDRTALHMRVSAEKVAA